MSSYQHQILLRLYQAKYFVMKMFHVHQTKYHIQNKDAYQDQDFQSNKEHTPPNKEFLNVKPLSK